MEKVLGSIPSYSIFAPLASTSAILFALLFETCQIGIGMIACSPHSAVSGAKSGSHHNCHHHFRLLERWGERDKEPYVNAYDAEVESDGNEYPGWAKVALISFYLGLEKRI